MDKIREKSDFLFAFEVLSPLLGAGEFLKNQELETGFCCAGVSAQLRD